MCGQPFHQSPWKQSSCQSTSILCYAQILFKRSQGLGRHASCKEDYAAHSFGIMAYFKRFVCSPLIKPRQATWLISTEFSGICAGCTRKRTQRSGSGSAGAARRKLLCLPARPAGAAGVVEGSSEIAVRRPVGRNSSRLGAWTPEEKQGLLDLVRELEPCGAADWEARPYPVSHSSVCRRTSRAHWMLCVAGALRGRRLALPNIALTAQHLGSPPQQNCFLCITVPRAVVRAASARSAAC